MSEDPRPRVKSFKPRDWTLVRHFEFVCKRLGLEERDAFDTALRHWIKENEQTVRLDNFIQKGTTIQIIQPQQVNIAIRAEVTIVKLELSRILRVLETASEESRPTFLSDLARAVLRASKVYKVSDDQELEELLTAADQYFK